MAYRDKLRKEALEEWPHLKHLADGYLNQDFDVLYSSVDAAIDQALADLPLEKRKATTKDWCRWNATAGAKDDLRRQIAEGLGIALMFETAHDARQFMNSLYDRLIVSIRKEEKGWKP